MRKVKKLVTIECYPYCAICNKPVDRFDAYYDSLHHRTTFTAHCHNRKEQIVIDDLEFATSKRIEIGYAFQGESE